MIGLEPGSIFAGRYEIIRGLGAGGMGAVFLACDIHDKDFKVALKLLYPGSMQNTQARERFRNEISASYRINHPNVVKAYEYFDAEDVQAFAMEYVDGGDLLDKIRNGAVSADEVTLLLKQCASALAAVHETGIIHRDLKPENILLTKKGEVKISDFGVARLKNAQTLTGLGNMVGTPKYLAPEYVETGECDARGDIFALGVIAYELVTGVSPFGPDFNQNKVLERISMKIPPPHEVTANCSEALSTIIMRAMAMRLSRRYANAQALLADIEQLQAGTFVAPKSTPSPHEELEYHPSSKAVDAPSISLPEPPRLTHDPKAFGEGEYLQFGAHTPPPKLVNPRSVQSKSRWMIAAGAASLLCAAIGVTSLTRAFLGSSVPPGAYLGLTSSTAPSLDKLPIVVIGTDLSTVILVMTEGCAATPLEHDADFSCKEIKDCHLTLNRADSSLLAGLVQCGDDRAIWTAFRRETLSSEFARAGTETSSAAANEIREERNRLRAERDQLRLILRQPDLSLSSVKNRVPAKKERKHE